MTTQFLSKLEFGSQSILGLTMTVSFIIASCIANVPVKTDRPSHSFDVNYVKTHLQSTQHEIVQHLGVPGLIFRFGKNTYYVYKAAGDLRRVAGIGLIVPPYFVPFFTWKEEDEALHCLALVFDENGLLQGYKTATGDEQAWTGMIVIPAPIEIPLGKEETGCITALWNDEEIRSLETVVQFEPPDTVEGTALAVGEVDGVSLVAAADGNHAVHLWDVRSDCLQDKSFNGHEELVTTIAFGEIDNAPVIITGSADQTVRLWDARTGEPLHKPLRGHEDRITLAAIMEVDGIPTVFSGAADQVIRMWDARTGQKLGELEGLLLAVGKIGGESLLVTSNFDHRIELRTLRSGRWQVKPLTLGSLPIVVSTVSLFEVDGKPMLATGSQDGAIRRWDTRSGKQLGNAMWGHQQSVTAVGFGEIGTVPVLLSIDATNRLRRWNASVGGLLSESAIHQEGGVVAIRLIDVDGLPIVATSTGDLDVRLWDGRSGSPMGEIAGKGPVSSEREILASKKEAQVGDAAAMLQKYYVDRYSRSSLKWLCLAADQGYRLAQLELASQYARGTPMVEQDRVLAYVWYSLLIRSGADEYRDQRTKLTTAMTPVQISEAERQLADWRPGQCERNLFPDVATGLHNFADDTQTGLEGLSEKKRCIP